jgi:CubicO group peptidase (beta-lactamase class C family)
MMILISAVSAAGHPDSAVERLDRILEAAASPGGPGAAILVVKNGRVVYERGRGVTDLRTLRPIDGKTNFRLASVTKAFTAAAVMLLVRDGKLGIEDRLTSVFPEFPDYGREIRIRHLLTHTSGLPDYESLMMPPAGAAGAGPQISDIEVLGLLERQKAGKFPPGSRWDYSNSGYVVLGLVVQKVSGVSFGRFLRDRIFLPLKMDGTLAYERGKNEVPDRAFGHTLESGAWRETDQSPTSATLGDGGVYSSLDDMAKWDAALRDRTLLGAAELEAAWTPVAAGGGPPVGPNGEPAAYGFGWFVNPWKGRARVWHYGETAGFRTAIQRFVDDGLTVVVLSNRADADAPELALEAAGLFLD